MTKCAWLTREDGEFLSLFLTHIYFTYISLIYLTLYTKCIWKIQQNITDQKCRVLTVFSVVKFKELSVLATLQSHHISATRHGEQNISGFRTGAVKGK